MPDYPGKNRKSEAFVDGLGSRVRFDFLLVAFFALLLGGCERQEAVPGAAVTLEPVTLCRGANMHLPLMVAEKQGFFAAQGLAVTVREFTLGRNALEAMLRDECDFSTAAEPPVVEYAAQRKDLRILASLQSTDNMVCILGRADRGIATPQDLRGKRIATVQGTIPHYFLDVFLQKNGLAFKDVGVVFMKADEVLGALSSGQVDAISMTRKVISQAQHSLQENGVLLEAPGLCRNYVMLLTTAGLLEKRAETAVRFLKAVAQSEEFILHHPQETLAIAHIGQEGAVAETEERLRSYQYNLTLDHGLLMGLEEAARWTSQQTGDGPGQSPNFLALIAAEPLQAVKPEAVNLGK